MSVFVHMKSDRGAMRSVYTHRFSWNLQSTQYRNLKGDPYRMLY